MQHADCYNDLNCGYSLPENLKYNRKKWTTNVRMSIIAAMAMCVILFLSPRKFGGITM